MKSILPPSKVQGNLTHIMNRSEPVARFWMTWGCCYCSNHCKIEFVTEKCPVQKPNFNLDTHSCWVFFVHLGCRELFEWTRVAVGWKSRALVFQIRPINSHSKHFGKQHIVSITCTMHIVNHVVRISDFLFLFCSLSAQRKHRQEQRINERL